MMNLTQLAARLAADALAMDRVLERSIEGACVNLEDSAKSAIGTYRFGWEPLAQSTQDDRVQQGYAADEPLLRTGELRDSILHNSDSHEGYVGTDLKIAVYQEFGTSTIPARPFLGGALIECEEKIMGIVGANIKAVIERT